MREFSFDTIEDFDGHINKSIPSFNILLNLIENISYSFIRDNYNVYDLGCSKGSLLLNLSKDNKTNTKFVGYDISSNLLPKKQDKVLFQKKDITEKDIKFVDPSLILSIFTLQFIDYSKRKPLLNKIYKSLNKGGAFIIAEKVFVEDSYIQDIFTFALYDYKINNFTPSEILSKQKDLRKIMFPLKEKENIKLFKEAGFKTIEPFFQSLNFKAWLCIK